MTKRKGEILIPRVDFERARITTRRAPNPKVDAGVGGWIEWQLIDRQGRVVRGGEQHNLFLNQGLNLISANPLRTSGWLVACSVGTSSVEPTPEQTELGAEISRTTSVLNSSDSGSVAEWRRSYHKQWEFAFGQGNGNLAEFAIIGPDNTPIVRELFRDAGGEPIVITKTSDYQLRLSYQLDIIFDGTPNFTPSSFTIDGLGVINGKFGWSSASQMEWAANVFGRVAAASTGTYQGRPVVSALPLANAADGGSFGNNGTAGGGSISWSSFTQGVYERSATVKFSTSQANITIATLAIRGGVDSQFNDPGPGFSFVIDPADRFTKDNEHTLTIDDLLTVTWGRA